MFDYFEKAEHKSHCLNPWTSAYSSAGRLTPYLGDC